MTMRQGEGAGMVTSRGVFITGGTSGIGWAAASEFLEHGDRVVIGGREQTRVDAAVSSLRKKHPAREISGVPIDVRDRASVPRAFADASTMLGSLQVVVNSAGIFPRRSLAELDDDTWEDTISTNLSGVFRCCKAASPLVQRAGGGSIVNVGSIWAKYTWPNRSAYAASKAAVEQFTRCIALELAPLGVRVNAVSPGIMRTAMTENVLETPAFVNTFMPRVTSGRVGEPAAELAGVIRFLTLDAAAYMYGEIVTVNGGYY
ncbi:MAG TPA: SDR family NAD(P)-dependent oxidoreductase [Candidatus Limnocylindria bacterium]